LARKCNVNGGLFGFVRFCKVRDVDKLLKDLNNMWFEDCRVVAKVASFDRFGNKNTDVVTRFEGEKSIEEEKSKMGDVNLSGEGIVKMCTPLVHKGSEDVMLLSGKAGGIPEEDKQVFIPKYNSSVDDFNWASKGVVVSVLNGEAIPVLQRRI